MKDATEAEAVLPATWGSADKGRATKGAAEALLAEQYIWRKDWPNAAANAKKIIDSGNYSLVPNYIQAFLPGSQNRPEEVFAAQSSSATGAPAIDIAAWEYPQHEPQLERWVGHVAAAAVVHRRLSGCRREAAAGVDHDVDAVGAEHLHDAVRRRARRGVRVAPRGTAAVDALLLAIAAHGLGDREHVRLVERPCRRGPAVPGGAEGDALALHGGIRPLVEVGADEGVDVDEVGRVGQAARRSRLTLMRRATADPATGRRPRPTRMSTPMMICR